MNFALFMVFLLFCSPEWSKDALRFAQGFTLLSVDKVKLRIKFWRANFTIPVRWKTVNASTKLVSRHNFSILIITILSLPHRYVKFSYRQSSICFINKLFTSISIIFLYNLKLTGFHGEFKVWSESDTIYIKTSSCLLLIRKYMLYGISNLLNAIFFINK